MLLFALLKESPTKTLFDSIVLYLIIQQRESLIKEILRQRQNFFDSLHWRATGAPYSRRLERIDYKGAALHPVRRVHENDLRLEAIELAVCKKHLADADDEIPLLCFVRRGSVDSDHPGVTGARYSVHGEALTVRDVANIPLPVRAHARFLEERLVDGDTALIVEIAVRNGCTVNLGPHHIP